MLFVNTNKRRAVLTPSAWTDVERSCADTYGACIVGILKHDILEMCPDKSTEIVLKTISRYVRLHRVIIINNKVITYSPLDYYLL